jgi:hypothetical protein
MAKGKELEKDGKAEVMVLAKDIKDTKDIKEAAALDQAAMAGEQEARARAPKVCHPNRAMVAEMGMKPTGQAMTAPMMTPALWLEQSTMHLNSLSPFLRLRSCLQWWQANAPPFVLSLITQGVEPHFQGQGLRLRHQKKTDSEVSLALEVMNDYVQVGAAQEVAREGTLYLVPWFVIQKVEANGKIKNRLISDCREINRKLNPPRFKLDHWRDIFPHLEKGMWEQRWT